MESLSHIEALEATAANYAAKPAAKKRTRVVEPHADAEKIPLPVFNSQDQCAACTGIPITTIKQAKKGGCSAFKQHRVDLALLLKWLFAQDESAINWGTRLDEYKAKREKIKLDADEQRVIDRSAVTSGIAKGTAILFGELEKAIQTLPPALKGLTESEIQSRLIQTVDVYRQAVRLALSEITKQPTSVDAQRP